MPVRKFRDPEEAERDLWRDPGDPEIWRAAIRRWKIHRFFSRGRLSPVRHGVFKYRSLEEKQKAEAGLD